MYMLRVPSYFISKECISQMVVKDSVILKYIYSQGE